MGTVSRRAVLAAATTTGLLTGCGLAADPVDTLQLEPEESTGAGARQPYRVVPYAVRPLPAAVAPFALGSPLPAVDRGLHDAHGVRMVRLGGRLYDHPVLQAQFGVNSLESHRLTRSRAHLQRAAAQADRLVDRRVRTGAAWWYPYRFPYQLHHLYGIYRAPWYSMMAQGIALSLFTRLYAATGQRRWRGAADATFASFLQPPRAGTPWGVRVVGDLLWLEEYPDPARIQADRTYNGHVFAAYGLYDHWLRTRDPRAALLLRGALTTASVAFGGIRRRGWRSDYCLAHHRDAGGYHDTHIKQLLTLHGITGDRGFAERADLLYRDYPIRGAGGPVRLAAGRHTAYRYTPDGDRIGSTTVVLRSPSTATARERVKVLNTPGVHYAVQDGPLAGHLLRERRGTAHRRELHSVLPYRQPRTGRTLAAAPGVPAGTALTVDARGIRDGVESLRVVAGPWRGGWIGAHAVRLG